MNGLRIGSLFSGYGGLEQGVQSVLGGTVAWHSEIDAGACKILAHRYPDVPNIGDITAVDWAAVEPVDVLTGGFPCQDVSAAGLRKGMRPDTRSGLWTQFAYAIDQLRPGLVVIENVRGLLSADAQHPAHSDLEPCPWCVGDGDRRSLRALGAVLGELADLGYDASWQGLRASDVGAPHGRFRVFVIAYPPCDAGRVRDRDDLCTGRGAVGREPHAGRGAAANPNGAVGGERRLAAPGQAEGGRARADAGGRGGAPAADADRGSVRQQPVAIGGRSGQAVAGLAGADAATDANDGRRRAHVPDLRAWEPDTGRGTAPHADGAGLGRLEEPHAASQAGHGASHRDDAHGLAVAARGVDWGPYGDAVRRWERRLGRPAPSPTQRGKNGQPRLAPAFVEWMMGLPAGWVTDVPGLGRNEQLKALGNGVVPQQAEHALRLLLPDARAAA